MYWDPLRFGEFLGGRVGDVVGFGFGPETDDWRLWICQIVYNAQVFEGRGVTFEDDRGGDAWKAVGKADVPCIGIHGDLESFREGDLEMLLDSDLVRKRVIGGCAVGK